MAVLFKYQAVVTHKCAVEISEYSEQSHPRTRSVLSYFNSGWYVDVVKSEKACLQSKRLVSVPHMLLILLPINIQSNSCRRKVSVFFLTDW